VCALNIYLQLYLFNKREGRKPQEIRKQTDFSVVCPLHHRDVPLHHGGPPLRGFVPARRGGRQAVRTAVQDRERRLAEHHERLQRL
jgi:hypothetical protein